MALLLPGKNTEPDYTDHLRQGCVERTKDEVVRLFR
jgi:hypothetical protein